MLPYWSWLIRLITWVDLVLTGNWKLVLQRERFLHWNIVSHCIFALHCKASVALFSDFYMQWETIWFQHVFLLLYCRCSPCRAGETVHPEAAAVLRPLRFCLGPTERSEMEGGEKGRSERDGGVHHPQQERHHRAYLPRGGSHGQYLNILSYRHEFVIDKSNIALNIIVKFLCVKSIYL